MNCNLGNIKRYEVLRAYCEKELGPVVEHGSYAMCACPFGQHQRHEHLQISDKDGIGLAHCFACGGGGTVLDVAAAVMGVNIREKGRFSEVMKHVAEVTGTPLNPSSSRSASNPPRQTASILRNKRPKSSTWTAIAVPPRVEHLSDADAAVAFNAVDLAHARPDLIQQHAEALGIPFESLIRHTERDHAERGLIGLTPDGRLLYVYTRKDETGTNRVVAVKLRGDNTGTDTQLLIRSGQWKSRGLMQHDSGTIQRFSFSAGKPACLFGVDALQGHHMGLLTEGESDKLALDAVLDAVRDDYLNPSSTPDDTQEEDIPIAIAKPSAGTFRPEWTAQFNGKAVILIADADEAGQKGAQETAARLRYAGALDIYMWSPPAGFKDVREMVTQSHCLLDVFDNIMKHSELLDTNE